MTHAAHADLPVYSAEEPPGTWTGTIPALEYGGFLPVGSGMMLPGYSGPFYGLAPRDDVNGDYGNRSTASCFHVLIMIRAISSRQHWFCSD